MAKKVLKATISLEFKLLFFTVALISTVVAFLLKNNLENQSRDKLNNAYQSQVMEARFLGDKIKNQLSQHIQSLRGLASYEANLENTSLYQDYIQATLSTDTELKNLMVFKVSYANKVLTQEKVYGESSNVVENVKNINQHNAYFWMTDKMFFGKVQGVDGVLVSFYNADEKNSMEGYLYSAIVSLDKTLVSQFSTMLVNTQTHQVLHNPTDVLSPKDLELQEILMSKHAAGSFSWTKNKVENMGSYSRVGNLLFVVYAPTIEVIGQVYDNMQDVILFGILVLGVALLGILFLAKTILAPINSLVKATDQIGSGNFDVKIENKSNDEIGVLASSFEDMTSKIKQQMKDLEESARLESEINIASTVQKTFFPDTDIVDDKFNLYSFYKSATECGGDIWSYIKHPKENKIILLIGDATGHGLSSAFVTAGLKTCFSMITKMIEEEKFEITPQNILNFANRAVYDAAQAKIMVTAFVAVIDLDSGEIVYSNCGHNPPWIMRQTSSKLESLAGPGIRLGQSPNLETIIERKNILEPGDRILFYTDGLMENTSEVTGEAFGKKAVRKILEGNFDIEGRELLNTLMEQYQEQCKKHEDDLTVVLLEYDLKNRPEVVEDESEEEEAS